MYKLYGIKNCDTVKKAKAWLEQHGIEFQFHDFRDNGLDLSTLECFESAIGWKGMINRRSTSWRQLSEVDKSDMDKSKALKLMLDHPTLVKRPVLETGSKIMIGFTPQQYQKEL